MILIGNKKKTEEKNKKNKKKKKKKRIEITATERSTIQKGGETGRATNLRLQDGIHYALREDIALRRVQ